MSKNKKKKSALWVVVSVLSLAALAACGGSNDLQADAGPDGSADGDADTDGDADADSDTDACSSPETVQPDAGLVWRRCLAGTCWEEGEQPGCSGEPLEVTWEEAAEACPDPYHLPTRDELAVLLDCEQFEQGMNELSCTPCFELAVCEEAFPGVEDLPAISREHLHWSSTEYDSANAWYAGFKTGSMQREGKGHKYTAACVRDE
ncbi:MAG: DUF1566 domain-containing protein [Polyangia bacterium]